MSVIQAFRCSTCFLLLVFFTGCKGQTNKNPAAAPEISGSAVLPKNIHSKDTSPGWIQSGQKILLTGVVYQSGGKTPAPGVVLYYYQTNVEGRYIHKPEEKRSMPPNEKGQTHGYIRGWVKTDSLGKYSIYTVRPGAYPARDFPAHVHVTIKEPNEIKEYYIDDFVFDDDKLLTSAYRKKMENRAGTGVVRLVQKGNLHIGERNIILGLNIPGHPEKSTVTSGKNIGEDIISFTPFHAWGPDKGTRTCPVCKYGWYNGILYFVGNSPDWTEIKKWLGFLEAESVKRGKYLKIYFIYGNETAYNKEQRQELLEQLGKALNLQKTALTFVPSFSDTVSDIYLTRVDQTTDNTFLIYKRSRVIDKHINLKATAENFETIAAALDKSMNEYFDLPGPAHE